MINNANLPALPAKRYFTLEEVCRLAAIRPEQLAHWQTHEGGLIGHGGSRFTRLDVIKIRQLQHGIADGFAQDAVDRYGNPAISANEMHNELEKILEKIEKTLAT